MKVGQNMASIKEFWLVSRPKKRHKEGKLTTWIGHKIVHMRNATLIYLNLTIQGKQTRKILRKQTAQ